MASDLVCIAFPAWEGNYVKSTVELVKRMANHHRILYVDYQYTYKDLIWSILKKGNAPAQRMLGLSPRLREIPMETGGSVFVLTPPPVLPVNFLRNSRMYDWFQKLNSWLIRPSIQKATKRLKFANVTVINAFNPFYGNYLLGKLGEQHTVYYCYDEISECAWARNHGARVEREFLRKVDATITSSVGLLASKKQFTKQSFLVQNGVDYLPFSAGYVDAATKVKTEKVIGYIGTLDSRIDYSLLEAIAQRFTDVRLTLIGRVVADKASVVEDVERIKELPNVSLVGAQPASALPGWLQKFHVGIIPFVKNPQTAAIYPMKINEYLAAGLPVVSTDFAPLSDFESTIAIATNPTDFIHAIQAAFETDSKESQQSRQAVAKGNSWEYRALEFERVLQNISA
ncbi:glycosyltransferase [Spirosoma litoris]